MEKEKLVPVNITEIQRIIPVFKQLFPFYSSQSVSQETFLTSLAAYGDNARQSFSLKSNQKDVAFVSFFLQKGRYKVENFLLRTSAFQAHGGVSFWLKQLEKNAKEVGAQEIVFDILPLNQSLQEIFQAQGYQETSHVGRYQFTKRLSYSTAIVLAGGGARGAYQIGAWRALRELGISYTMLIGTSVGALNGALMLQDDFAIGEKMWHEIETQQILSYPHVGDGGSFTVKQTIKEMQQLAHSALQNQGVSTAPLAKLIDDLLDEEKMMEAPQDFYLCTTELPSLKEVVISLADLEPGTFNRWLLASSSFFPAMAATKIDHKYYVDGGYRNNIPVDVALKQGATELIVLDVKGPGITKPTKVPVEIPQLIVTSPWSLGTVLLFDGARSSWNIELGYLETLKAFGRYRGYWYTLEADFREQVFSETVAKETATFIAGLSLGEQKLFQEPANFAYLAHKISQRYGERVTFEGIYLYLLEVVGKYLDVKPTKLYTLTSFRSEIQAQIEGKVLRDSIQEETMLLSLTEWLQRYAGDLPLPTERQQITFLYNALADDAEDPLLLNLAKIMPVNYLVAKLLLMFEQGLL